MNAASHLRDWLGLHRKVATLATLLALLPFSLLAHNFQWQISIFLLNVLLFGVCHGSLDYLRCPKDRNDSVSILRLTFFLLTYILLSALLLWVWFHDPGPMLVSFLSVSCLHFALDEEQELSLAKKFLWGFLPVLAPCFLHATAVSEVFSFLIGSEVSFSVTMSAVLKILGCMLVGLACSSIILDFFSAWEARSKAALGDCAAALALLLSYVLLPPLLSFTIYFCWWHSMRQCLRQIAQFDSVNFLNGFSIFFKKAAVFTFGSWLMAAVIYLIATKSLIPVPNSMAGLYLSEAPLQAVRAMFYLLSALTVPHMFLSLFGTSRSVQKAAV
ncbi:MAG: Brp/Blh family beta-carotene 15,15'-dioxygenase [Leptolyngbya sp.]|nr:Brp/Blh family beta-carotene 15,15'-dioxygenase [Candidatus Melainabacteria bacterium]